MSFQSSNLQKHYKHTANDISSLILFDYIISILGGVTVIIGLYLLLWGKEKDQSYNKSQEQSSSHFYEIKVKDKEEVASALKAEP